MTISIDSLSSKHTIFGFVRGGLRSLMGNRSFSEAASFLSLALVCLGLAILGSLVVSPFDSGAIGPVENGWYETTEALVIGGAGLVFFTVAIRFRHEMFYFSAIATFFCVLAVARETPRCGSPFYDGGLCFTSDTKTLIAAVAFIVVCALMAWKRVPLAKQWGELNFFYIVPTTISALMLVSSEIFGTFVLIWAEEIVEMGSYLNLFVFAIVLHLRPGWFDYRQQNKRTDPEGFAYKEEYGTSQA